MSLGGYLPAAFPRATAVRRANVMGTAEAVVGCTDTGIFGIVTDRDLEPARWVIREIG